MSFPVTGPADEPTSERPTRPGIRRRPSSGWASPPAWGSPPQSGWNYGYGGLWTPPPETPPSRGPNPAAGAGDDRGRRARARLGRARRGHQRRGARQLHVAAGRVAVHRRLEQQPVRLRIRNPGTGNTATDAVASKVSPALVNIYTTIDTSDDGRGQAAGTGMVITSSGEVLTNNHVIADASTVRVELVATGDTHTAKVLGYDVKDDVALLKIDNVSDLNTVSFADASKVAIGDSVVAIGNAGGRGGDPTVTSGSVTALDQKVTAGDQGTGASETLVGMIEISAPIEPGDSGGPLVNSKGQVIGMNTAAATSDRFSGQAVSSTAFAIPINRAVRIAEQIRNQEESANVHVGDRGLLGVRVQGNRFAASCLPGDDQLRCARRRHPVRLTGRLGRTRPVRRDRVGRRQERRQHVGSQRGDVPVSPRRDGVGALGRPRGRLAPGRPDPDPRPARITKSV